MWKSGLVISSPGCSSVFWSPFSSAAAWARCFPLPVCLEEDLPCLCGGLGQLKIYFPISSAPEPMGWVSLESAFELSRFTRCASLQGKQEPGVVFFKSHASSLKLKFTNVSAILILWVSWTTGGVISSVMPKCVILAQRNSNFALRSTSLKVAAALILYQLRRQVMCLGRA